MLRLFTNSFGPEGLGAKSYDGLLRLFTNSFGPVGLGAKSYDGLLRLFTNDYVESEISDWSADGEPRLTDAGWREWIRRARLSTKRAIQLRLTF